MSALHRIRTANRILLGSTMVVMCVSVGLGVVWRYVLGSPLLWPDEIARLALVWLTFLGAAQLFSYQTGHLSLTFLTERLPPRPRTYLAIGVSAVELLLMFVVGAGAMVFIHFNAESVTSALELPIYLVYGVIPASAAVATFFCWRRLLAHAMGRNPELIAPAVEMDAH